LLPADQSRTLWLDRPAVSIAAHSCAGLALPAAVWVLGLLAPRPGGLAPGFVLAYTVLLAGLSAVDLTAP